MKLYTTEKIVLTDSTDKLQYVTALPRTFFFSKINKRTALCTSHKISSTIYYYILQQCNFTNYTFASFHQSHYLFPRGPSTRRTYKTQHRKPRPARESNSWPSYCEITVLPCCYMWCRLGQDGPLTETMLKLDLELKTPLIYESSAEVIGCLWKCQGSKAKAIIKVCAVSWLLVKFNLFCFFGVIVALVHFDIFSLISMATTQNQSHSAAVILLGTVSAVCAVPV